MADSDQQAKADAAQAKADVAQGKANDAASKDAPPLVLPDIHYLQAERASLQMNRDAIDPPQNDATDAAIKEIDAKIAAIDKTLAANKNLTGN
jgi:hypothetical protein